MENSPFKGLSIKEIEECISRALTTLLSQEGKVEVTIDALAVTGNKGQRASFEVQASFSPNMTDDLPF